MLLWALPCNGNMHILNSEKWVINVHCGLFETSAHVKVCTWCAWVVRINDFLYLLEAEIFVLPSFSFFFFWGRGSADGVMVCKWTEYSHCFLLLSYWTNIMDKMVSFLLFFLIDLCFSLLNISVLFSFCNLICSICFFAVSVKKDFELARRLGGIGRPW